jgi:hypothetical protein
MAKILKQFSWESQITPDNSVKESFSSVIRRAEWPIGGTRGSDLLALLATLPPTPPETLTTLDANQNLDQPPIAKWL